MLTLANSEGKEMSEHDWNLLQEYTSIRTLCEMQVFEYFDAAADEVNRTHLAEYACAETGGWNRDGSIPERYFEIAHEVAEWYEQWDERFGL